MNPTISIIIATYNSASTLQRALESVLNQSFQDWECIIVDGASKDGTVGIVKEYVNADSRFRYISEPDKGIYDAFNKGWGMAKGEWIYYLGSDDLLIQDGLYNLLQSKGRADVLYGDVILNMSGRRKYSHSISTDSVGKRMMSHQSILMQRKHLLELNGFNTEYKICADFDLVQRLKLNGFTCYHVCTPVVVFNCGGVSGQNYKMTLKEAYKIHTTYRTLNRGALIFKIGYKYIKGFIKGTINRLFQ